MTELKNRSELVFLYDVTDANPNGDPLDEDKPRIDKETEVNIVTDVRLKRTIRDYLRDYKNQNIFIQAEKVVEGGEELIKARGTKLEEELLKLLKLEEKFEGEELKEIDENLHSILGEKGRKLHDKFVDCLKKDRSKEQKEELFEKFKELRTSGIKEHVFGEFIDLRLFGATLAVANINVQQTGPVQFKFGRSLHQVDYDFYKGSITMPVEPGPGKEKGKAQAEFSEEYRLPYSLISFYGIVNENAAQSTGITEEDIQLLLDGIWNGTKNLITRSKIGHVPRFLLRVTYKDGNYHIGDLDKGIKVVDKDGGELDSIEQKRLRSIDEIQVDLTELLTVIKENNDEIANIELKVEPRIKFRLPKGEMATGKELLNSLEQEIGSKVTEIIFS